MIPLAMPTEAPTWPTCTITFNVGRLDRQDRKALRHARKKIRKVTGVRWRRVAGRAHFNGFDLQSGGMIDIRYRALDERWILAWGGYQSRRGHIFWGYAHLNSNRRDGDRKHILMHELGHAMGLVHNPTNRWAVMYGTDNGVHQWARSDKRALKRATPNCR